MANGDTEQRLKADADSKPPPSTGAFQTQQPTLALWPAAVIAVASLAIAAVGSMSSPHIKDEMLAFINKPGGMIDLAWMTIIISGMFYLVERVLLTVATLKTHIATEDQALLAIYKRVKDLEGEVRALASPLNRLADALEESGEIEPAHLTPVLDRMIETLKGIDKKL